MPKVRGIAHEWTAKINEVDFIRDKGGFYAVKLTLDTTNAQKFAKGIRACLKNAENNRLNSIDIIAHWGKRAKAKEGQPGGFRLRTKAHAEEQTS